MLLGLESIDKVDHDGEGIASVAKTRNAMQSSEILSLGPIVKSNDDMLQIILRVHKVKRKALGTELIE